MCEAIYICNTQKTLKKSMDGSFSYIVRILSLLKWPPCISSMLNLWGWGSLPGAEASGPLGTAPIALRATLYLIRQISI